MSKLNTSLTNVKKKTDGVYRKVAIVWKELNIYVYLKNSSNAYRKEQNNETELKHTLSRQNLK